MSSKQIGDQFFSDASSNSTIILQAKKLDSSDLSRLILTLSQNNSLTSLTLRQVGLEDRDVIALCSALQNKANLTQLDLSGNGFGEKGGQALIELLSRNALSNINIDKQDKFFSSLTEKTKNLIAWQTRCNGITKTPSEDHKHEYNELTKKASKLRETAYSDGNLAICSAYELLDQVPILYQRHIDQDSFLTPEILFIVSSHILEVFQSDFPLPSQTKLLFMQVALHYLYLGVTRMQDSYIPVVLYKEYIEALKLRVNRLKTTFPQDDYRYEYYIEAYLRTLNFIDTDENLFLTFLKIVPSAVKLEFSQLKVSLASLHSKLTKSSSIVALLLRQLSSIVMFGGLSQLDVMEQICLEDNTDFLTFTYFDCLSEIVKRSTIKEGQEKAIAKWQTYIESNVKKLTQAIWLKTAEMACELQYVDDEVIVEKVRNLIRLIQNKNYSSVFLIKLDQLEKEGNGKNWRYYHAVYHKPKESSSFEATHSSEGELVIFKSSDPPFESELFVERPELEKRLFQWTKRARQMPRARSLCVLQGMAGLGKTTAAKRFYYSSDHLLKIWFSAERIEVLAAQCKKFWNILHPDQFLVDAMQCIYVFNQYLEKHSGFLIVYDNATSEIIPYLPKSGGQILITTRESAGWRGNLIEIPPMEREEAREMVQKTLVREKEEDIDLLIQKLEGVPLLLSGVVGYIFSKPPLSIREFLADFEKQHEHAMEFGGSDSVYTIFKKILSDFEAKQSPAAEFLYICSYLQSEEIPESFLRACIDEFDQAMQDLRPLSLFQINFQVKTFTLHRLVQDVCRRCDSNRNKHIEKIVTTYKNLMDEKKQEKDVFLSSLFLPHLISIESYCGDDWKKNHSAIYSWLEECISSFKEESRSPLIEAIKTKSRGVITYLLEQDVDIHVRDKGGWTPLFAAILANLPEVLLKLVEKGADVNEHENSENLTPLMLASSVGGLEMVKILLENKADVYSVDNKGNTALFYAVRGIEKVFLSLFSFNETKGIIELLVSYGSNVNAINYKNRSPLFVSLKYYCPWSSAIVSLLIQLGVDVNQRDTAGKNVLKIAKDNGIIEVIAILMRNGAIWEGDDRDEITKLMWAVLNRNNEEAIRQIIRGANINAQDCDGISVLMWAIALNCSEVVETLIRMKVNVNVDVKGISPLMLCAITGERELTQRLIDKNANVNDRKNRHKMSALMYASLFGHLEIARNLLENSAKVNDENVYGDTAFDLAQSEKMKKLLESYGAQNGNHDLDSQYSECVLL